MYLPCFSAIKFSYINFETNKRVVTRWTFAYLLSTKSIFVEFAKLLLGKFSSQTGPKNKLHKIWEPCERTRDRITGSARMEDPWTNDWDLFAVRKIDTVCRHYSRRTLYPQRVREKFKARFAKENDLAPSNIPERRMKTGTNAVRVDCTVNRAFVTRRIQSEILYRVSRFPLSHALPSFVLNQLVPYGLPRKSIVRFSKSGSRIFGASFKISSLLTLELFYRFAYTLKAKNWL